MSCKFRHYLNGNIESHGGYGLGTISLAAGNIIRSMSRILYTPRRVSKEALAVLSDAHIQSSSLHRRCSCKTPHFQKIRWHLDNGERMSEAVTRMHAKKAQSTSLEFRQSKPSLIAFCRAWKLGKDFVHFQSRRAWVVSVIDVCRLAYRVGFIVPPMLKLMVTITAAVGISSHCVRLPNVPKKISM